MHHVKNIERAVDDAIAQLYGRAGVDGFWVSRCSGPRLRVTRDEVVERIALSRQNPIGMSLTEVAGFVCEMVEERRVLSGEPAEGAKRILPKRKN